MVVGSPWDRIKAARSAVLGFQYGDTCNTAIRISMFVYEYMFEVNWVYGGPITQYQMLYALDAFVEW